ncbi:MAG TPA: hypothetical protein VFB62_19100, partial [Polyangiaceae bacterium]|nr:hypothetical protein [Polyangiaceae bacterium]
MRFQGWPIIAMLVALASPSWSAEPTAGERSLALKLAGEAMDLFTAGDYEAALDKFSRADGILPAPTLKLRIARCLDKLDRMLEAADKYREVIAAELGKKAPAQHHEARREAVPELAKLLEQVPTVLVVVEGQGSGEARVLLEGAPLPREAVGEKQPLDPGTYSFEARVGERHVRKVITLKRGEHQRVELVLPEVPREKTPGTTMPPKREDVGRSVRIVGWTAVGLGGAALSLGSIAGVLVLTREEDLLARCPDRQCPPSEH